MCVCVCRLHQSEHLICESGDAVTLTRRYESDYFDGSEMMFAQGVLSVNLCFRFLVMVAVIIGGSEVALAEIAFTLEDTEFDTGPPVSYTMDTYSVTDYGGPLNPVTTDQPYVTTISSLPYYGNFYDSRIKITLIFSNSLGVKAVYGKVYRSTNGGPKVFVKTISGTRVTNIGP